MTTRKFILINDTKMELPLFFYKLHSIPLENQKDDFEERIIKSLFYNTNSHLLNYSYKTII